MHFAEATASKRKLSAAIDIGTTFSGYAYSLFDDPTGITTNKFWSDAENVRMTYKAPTVVLVTHDGIFDSFGYEAETKYATLSSNKRHKDWYYFRHFKMSLYQQKLPSRSLEIPDIQLKQFNAMEVFSMAIRYLKDHMLKLIDKQYGSNVGQSDIQFVLTVPAIWDESAKQFMRESAIKAGIHEDHITIALEPEAASICCRSSATAALPGNQNALADIESPGSCYMVVDAGGGTVDITVHQVEARGKLKELHCASGGDWGGNTVNEKYINFLNELFTLPLMNCFRSDHLVDWLEMERAFEIQKSRVGPTDIPFYIRIPSALTELYVGTPGGIEGFGDQVTFRGDKLKVVSRLVRSWFLPTCDKITEHVGKLLRLQECADVTTILMVGGFSESPLLYERMRTLLSKYDVFVPKDASLAVLKGAVLFGHDPVAINVRIAPNTYGFRISPLFDESKHDPNKQTIIEGRKRCNDVFRRFIQVDQEVTLGKMSERIVFKPVYTNQTELTLAVFRSNEKNPTYTTDGCTHVGELTVTMEDLKGGLDREVWVNVLFGGTEMEVKAHEVNSGVDYYEMFDFLSK